MNRLTNKIAILSALAAVLAFGVTTASADEAAAGAPPAGAVQQPPQPPAPGNAVAAPAGDEATAAEDEGDDMGDDMGDDSGSDEEDPAD